MKNIIKIMVLFMSINLAHAETVLEGIIPKGQFISIGTIETEGNKSKFPAKIYDLAQINIIKLRYISGEPINLSRYNAILTKGKLYLNSYNASSDTYTTTIVLGSETTFVGNFYSKPSALQTAGYEINNQKTYKVSDVFNRKISPDNLTKLAQTYNTNPFVLSIDSSNEIDMTTIKDIHVKIKLYSTLENN